LIPEPTFRHRDTPGIGVLLVNLGTPEAPTAGAVRRYLKEFLWDPRVVEIPRPIWWLILNGIILNTRPERVAHKYAQVWLAEGSPLRVYTERQAEGVRRALAADDGGPVQVAVAMRYGSPSLAEGLAELKAAHCDRILLLPLYPQYASSTTGSTFARCAELLGQMRNVPALHAIKHFHDDPDYVAALATNLTEYWAQHGTPQRLLLSFHGLPRFHLDQGDPYFCECHKTARLLRERLGWPEDKLLVSFQSRFGKAEWLKPYTSDVLRELGSAKLARLDVCCPGFTADCLETLEEIAVEGRDEFQQAGGGEFRYIPVANDTPAFVEALTRIVRKHLTVWATPATDAALREVLAKAQGAAA
jgi:ferrochelatase